MVLDGDTQKVIESDETKKNEDVFRHERHVKVAACGQKEVRPQFLRKEIISYDDRREKDYER